MLVKLSADNKISFENQFKNMHFEKKTKLHFFYVKCLV